jgi:hypothetical protein
MQGFYDSMQFWNKNEGIAMGDPKLIVFRLLLPEMAGTWNKVPVQTPKIVEESCFCSK